MSNFTGMDIQAVRTLATQFQTRAGEIETLRRDLTGQLGNTSWIGDDRNRFEQDWMNVHMPALQNVIDALNEACNRANTNATEQENASR